MYSLDPKPRVHNTTTAVYLLSDKSTQADSSKISLVQVDLEQIKYIIQPTFLDQIEMQVNR